MKTHLDWSGYDTYGIGDAYSGIPARGGNYAKAVAVCMHNRECQREGRGVMCPSYRITHDPAHSTEARVAAFKAALNGDYGDDPFGDARLAAAMDLCVSCKACKKECPSAVDMVLIKTEYLAQRNDAHGVSLRTRLFAGLPAWLGAWRRPARWLVQVRNALPPVAWAAEKLLGLTSKRPLPAPAARPFAARGAVRLGRARRRLAVRRHFRAAFRSRDRRSRHRGSGGGRLSRAHRAPGARRS